MNPSDADRQRTFVEPAIYYAQLAAVHVATGALITDPAGRVLVVKPFYRPHWLLPGGTIDEGEPPEAACARELDEELGLRVEVGRLLVVDWAPPSGHRTRPLMYLLFDAGIVDEPDLRLQHAELDDAAFCPPEEAAARLAEADAARVPAAALAVRERGITVYRPSSG